MNTLVTNYYPNYPSKLHYTENDEPLDEQTSKHENNGKHNTLKMVNKSASRHLMHQNDEKDKHLKSNLEQRTRLNVVKRMNVTE